MVCSGLQSVHTGSIPILVSTTQASTCRQDRLPRAALGVSLKVLPVLAVAAFFECWSVPCTSAHRRVRWLKPER